jgi:hypothetical protein
MMTHFRIQYRPGGMGLDHSAWWLVLCTVVGGVWTQIPLRRLRRSDYQ